VTLLEEYRVICDCQRHARSRNRWRRVVRIATRGVAVLATVPFAYFFDIPTKAMSLNVGALRPQLGAQRIAAPRLVQPAFPVFTTPATSEQFISSATVEQIASVDAFKEQYFRAHVPYGSIIYREARKNNLQPELVAAMVHTESDFRPHLVSHKSAQGLMQIIPDTARDLGLANVFDPEQNIAAGTRYFRYLLDRFENERIALAAYNAGEGKVERCSCVPEIAETVSYIEKVNVRASRYRQRVRNEYLAMSRLRPDGAH
jgi:soluble lytic murein transglycosylase-like protein